MSATILTYYVATSIVRWIYGEKLCAAGCWCDMGKRVVVAIIVCCFVLTVVFDAESRRFRRKSRSKARSYSYSSSYTKKIRKAPTYNRAQYLRKRSASFKKSRDLLNRPTQAKLVRKPRKYSGKPTAKKASSPAARKASSQISTYRAKNRYNLPDSVVKDPQLINSIGYMRSKPHLRHYGDLAARLAQGHPVSSAQYMRSIPSGISDADRLIIVGTFIGVYNAVKAETLKPAAEALSANPNVASIFDSGGGLNQNYAPDEPPLMMDNGKKVALLIGIEEYGQEILNLDTPISDIDEVGYILELKYGYLPVYLRNPSKSELVQALAHVVENLDKNDKLLVYYAGHGFYVEETNTGFWIPADATPEDPTNWLSNTDINTLLVRAKAESIFIVSDSCYAGSLFTSGTHLNEKASPKVAVALTSGGLEPVADGGGDNHSFFAQVFLTLLKGLPQETYVSNLHPIILKEVSDQMPQEPQFGGLDVLGHKADEDFLVSTRPQVVLSAGGEK